MIKRFSLILGLVIAFGISPPRALSELESGMDADYVIGQPGFGSVTAGTTELVMSGPKGMFSDGKFLVVTDENNERVLIFNQIPTKSGAAADIVLGQPDFTSNATNNGGIGPNTINSAEGVTFAGGKFYIADRANRRVLGFNSFPTVNFQAADFVLGKNDFVTSGNSGGPSGHRPTRDVCSDGTRLYVADQTNHRVALWNSLPSRTAQPMDIAIGQVSLNSLTATTSRNGLSAPHGVSCDGTTVVVADTGNHRVMIWNKIPTRTNQAADVVLGQQDFDSAVANSGPSGMNGPQGVYSDGESLYVADTANNRVLIWKKIPTQNGTPADFVLGQNNFSNIAFGTGRNQMRTPLKLIKVGRRLFVADHVNNRVLVFIVGGESSLVNLGPQFNQGKAVVGKVFWDFNGNGRQDP